MPVLLESLAAETSASIWRVADRLDEEARELDDRWHAEAELKDLKGQTVESARQATMYALSRLAEAEAVWRSALFALRNTVAGDDAKGLLRALHKMFEAVQRLFNAPQELWRMAEKMGAPSEQLEDLERGRQRFADWQAEVAFALEHREQEWKPADSDRFALGLQLAREGKTIKADAARSRFQSA